VPHWTKSQAVSQLRIVLGDGRSDKFIFRGDALPPADGMTTRFFTGDKRIVESSLTVYEDGTERAISGDPDFESGTFDLFPPPAVSGLVQASYNYRWFTDLELQSYLESNTMTLGYTGLDDSSIPLGVRGIIAEFSACSAYRRRAADTAEELSVEGGGYSADRSRQMPNWSRLANEMCQSATDKLKLFVENPLTGTNTTPAMKFVAFGLAPYVPTS